MEAVAFRLDSFCVAAPGWQAKKARRTHEKEDFR